MYKYNNEEKDIGFDNNNNVNIKHIRYINIKI